MDTEWKHSRVAWAPPCTPLENWWRRVEGLTLRVEVDEWSDARGVRVGGGVTSYERNCTAPRAERVLAVVWSTWDRNTETCPAKGRLLARDYPTLDAALEAAKAAAEAAARIYTQEVA